MRPKTSRHTYKKTVHLETQYYTSKYVKSNKSDNENY